MPALNVLAILVAGLVWAAPAVAQVARVLDAKGTSIVERAGKPSRILGQGEQLDEKDVISVARDSYAVLEFRDKTRITLRPNTVFRLDTYKDTESESMLFGLVKGGFRAVTGLVGKANPKAVNFTTATATIGIRGTEFDARLCEDDCATEERLGDRPRFPVAARLVDLKGSVVAVNVENVSRKLVPGSYVRQFDEVRTAGESVAVLLLRDGGRLVLHPATRVAFQRFSYEPTRPADAEVDLMLLAGRIGTQTGAIGKARPVGYRISTRYGRLETRGTATEIGCIRACAEPERRAADQPRTTGGDRPPARPVGPAFPAAAAKAVAATPTGLPVPAWRTQPMTPQSKQALMDNAQRAGMSSPARTSLRLLLNSSPSKSYEQVRQQLLKSDVAGWRQLGTAVGAASSPEALLSALDTPMNLQDWRAQQMSAAAKQALVAFAQRAGIAGADAFLDMSMTYLELQQGLQNDASFAPVLAVLAGASSPETVVTAFNSADWRNLPISEQVKQALFTYAQNSNGPGGLQTVMSSYPSMTYAQFQELLGQYPSDPWAASLLAIFAGATGVPDLSVTLNAPPAPPALADWRSQLLSQQTKQAILAYLQVVSPGSVEYVQSSLNQPPSLTYAQLLQALQGAGTVFPWAGPLAGIIADASSADTLNNALNSVDWRTLAISEQAKQAILGYLQDHAVSPNESSYIQGALSQSPPVTYAQLLPLLTMANASWANELASTLAGASSPDALVSTLDWRTQTMSADAWQALVALGQQIGLLPMDLSASSLASMYSSFTYEDVQQMLQADPNWAPVAARFAGVSSPQELVAALSAPTEWRQTAISEQVKQAILDYVQRVGGDVNGLQQAFEDYPTYGLLQQALEQAAGYAPWVVELAAKFAGANGVDALAAALAPPDWRTLAMSAEAKQAIAVLAQQLGLPGADQVAGLDLTYEQFQAAIQSVSQWGPIQALLTQATSYDSFLSSLTPSLVQTPEAPDMEVSVTEGAVDVTTSAGTQTVGQGQTGASGVPGGPLRIAAFKPAPGASEPPAIQLLRIDSGRVFGDEPAANPERGLYVWVREGAVQLAKGAEAVDVPAGGAAVATADRVVLLEVVPNFMRFDATPRPLPAGGVRVADAFVAADGSQFSMCSVR